MKKNIYKKIFLISSFSLAIIGCDNKNEINWTPVPASTSIDWTPVVPASIPSSKIIPSIQPERLMPTIENNFFLDLSSSVAGAWHTVDRETGWKKLVSIDNLLKNISFYNSFQFALNGWIYTDHIFPPSNNFLSSSVSNYGEKYTSLINFSFDKNTFLKSDSITKKTWSLSENSGAGYTEVSLTLQFRIQGNSIWMNAIAHSYAGWCLEVFGYNGVHLHIKVGDNLIFFNQKK